MLVTTRHGIYVDATLGGGGHSAALLRKLSPVARVIGIDRDANALKAANERLAAMSNFTALHGRFGNLGTLLKNQSVRQIDGLLLDLGVSSHQLDCAPRGFSHRHKATPDMRMDQQTGAPADKLINEWPLKTLEKTLFTWGEEPQARRIARAIVAARPVRSTTELAAIIRGASPVRHEAKAVARVFQAIRIAVNGEMDELEAVLRQAPELVKIGGRLVVVSYHSLEDRRVKRMIRHGNLAGEPWRDLYGRSLSPWRALLRKPVTASEDEVLSNPRARSARLRAAERVRTPDSSRKHPKPYI